MVIRGNAWWVRHWGRSTLVALQAMYVLWALRVRRDHDHGHESGCGHGDDGDGQQLTE
jgi:hypothetical protein